MKHVRALIKLLFVAILTLGLCSVYVIGLIFLKISGSRFEPWRNRIIRTWAGGMSRILNMHIHPVGNVPEPPFFLVSNHLSYIDIVPLFYTLTCTFIVKKEVKSWPVVGMLVRLMGVIFVDRSRKRDVTRVNELISRGLSEYQGMILFPEGTTSAGFDVLPFKASLLEYPAVSGLSVHYASIQYETSEKDQPAHISVCWWGDIPFLIHAYMLASLKRIDCTIRFGKDTIRNQDRKQLAAELQSRVEAQLTGGRTQNAKAE